MQLISCLVTVAKEKFPGTKVEDLKPEEFDAVFKESSARRGAAQVQAKEAAKAVKTAQAAANPTPEAQALAKGRLALRVRQSARQRASAVSSYQNSSLSTRSAQVRYLLKKVNISRRSRAVSR